MRSRLRLRRPSPALAVALAAVFLALGSSSFAAPAREAAARLITGKQVKNGSLSEKDLSRAARAKLRGRTGARGPAGSPGATGAAGRDGAKGDRGPSAIRLSYVVPGGGTFSNEQFTTVGPWEIRLTCNYNPGLGMSLAAKGPGGAHFSGIYAENNDNASATSYAADLNPSSPTTILALSEDTNEFVARKGGTIELFDGTTHATVSFSATADLRGTDNCGWHGTAVPAA